MNYRDEETYQFFENQNNPNENSEFEFKDTYWDEMESMLDSHDAKKRKRRGAFIWFSSVATIIIAFFGLYQLDGFLYPTETASIDMPLAEADVSNANASGSLAKSQLAVSLENQNDPGVSNANVLGTEELSNQKPTKVITLEKGNNINVGHAEVDLSEIFDETNYSAIELGQQMKATERLYQEDEAKYMESLTTIEIPQEVTNQINLEEKKIKYPLKHSFYTVFEAGMVNQYQPSSGVSFGVLAGLGYEIGFHKNLAFQTGVNFQYRDGLNLFYRNESKVYGYHSIRYYQDVYYKGQLNVEIPLALKIKFKRSSITTGVGTSFLITTRSTVDQFTRESTSVEKLKNNFGIRDGIRNMDVNLNLSYAYAVSPNLELSAGVSAGLLDQTSNEFFNNDHKDHNLQFRLGLKYFFFNK